jgi:hypothetical protein
LKTLRNIQKKKLKKEKGSFLFFSTFLADNPLKKEELDIFVHFILKMGAYSSKSWVKECVRMIFYYGGSSK